ncbi:MAG: double zinc ribbon domain-containing protein [Ruminococcus sp.]|nr:double zinc ribbon domain-containing protein [Ruminococcus sp.]
MDYFLKRKILNLFFPNRCPVCSELIKENDRFCPECTERLTLYTGSFRITGASECFSALVYDKSVKQAVFLLKKGNCGNADYAFGAYLADVLKNNNVPERVDFIVPVPMSKQSRRKRGYNQSELIAKAVSAETGIPVKCIVQKVRNTKEQKTLGRAGRIMNLKDAFEVDGDVTSKKILLLDDICTTGSTFSEIAVLLRKKGAEDVFCASAMKVVKSH